MVAGLDRFRERFARRGHQYALIGGSACDLLLEQAGLSFRATKDLDIVPLAEALDAGFGRDFWAFVRDDMGRFIVEPRRDPIGVKGLGVESLDEALEQLLRMCGEG